MPVTQSGLSPRVLFQANDLTTGIEMWMSNGTVAGTVPVTDIAPLNASSSPANPRIVAALDVMFFTANDGTTGIELWSIPLTTIHAAILENYGAGCAGTGGLVPHAFCPGLPLLGNAAFAIAQNNARPSSQCALIVGATPANTPISGCTLLATPTITVGSTTTATGTAAINVPLPNNAALLGVTAFTQWATVDPNGTLFNVIALSEGRQLKIGD